MSEPESSGRRREASHDRPPRGVTTGTTAPSGRAFGRRTAGVLALWGLLVWLAVAVSTRLVGHVLLSPAAPLVVAGVFAATVPLMALVTYPVYWRLSVPHARRGTAAAVMSLPGLFLDPLLLLFAGTVFPSMTRGAVVTFGAVLLFGYAVVLLTGVVPAGDGRTA